MNNMYAFICSLYNKKRMTAFKNIISMAKIYMAKAKMDMASGFVVGFVVGCIPNNPIHIQVSGVQVSGVQVSGVQVSGVQVTGKRYNNVPVPVITAVLGSVCMLIYPLILSNYFLSNCFLSNSYIDKWIDRYDFNIQRYHQYDGNNNKYAYPSILEINIKKRIGSNPK